MEEPLAYAGTTRYGEQPQTPVDTPSEKTKFKAEVSNEFCSGRRGSASDWNGFAESWINDVKRIEEHVRDHLLVEDGGEKREKGSATTTSPGSSSVRFADRLNRKTAASLAHHWVT